MLAGHGDALSAGSPFGLIGHAIRGAAGISDGDPPQVRHARLRTRLAKTVPAAALPHVAAFFGRDDRRAGRVGRTGR